MAWHAYTSNVPIAILLFATLFAAYLAAYTLLTILASKAGARAAKLVPMDALLCESLKFAFKTGRSICGLMVHAHALYRCLVGHL